MAKHFFDPWTFEHWDDQILEPHHGLKDQFYLFISAKSKHFVQ